MSEPLGGPRDEPAGAARPGTRIVPGGRRRGRAGRPALVLVPERDAAAGEVVGRDLERHAVAGEDAQPGPRQFYQKFGLKEAQIEMIRQAIPKRHYLIDSPDGAALIDLRLGRKALKFVGSGSKSYLARIDRLFADHGDDWVKFWLEAA